MCVDCINTLFANSKHAWLQAPSYLLSDPLPLDELSSESESLLLSSSEESESLSSLLLSSDPACRGRPTHLLGSPSYAC